MPNFLWPSDQDRADNDELNRVCEYAEVLHSMLLTAHAQGGQGAEVVGLKEFWQKLQTFVDNYVSGYEFRGEGDYTPNEAERFLIEDCVAGLLHELGAEGYLNKPAHPQPAVPEGAYEHLHKTIELLTKKLIRAESAVPEGWRVIRMPELQKALMTGPIIGLVGPRGESVTVVSDSDDRRDRLLYQFLDALLSAPTTPQTDGWVGCDREQIKSVLTNLQYAGFNLLDHFDFDCIQGPKRRAVESTCPETSLLIAIRDLSELIGEPLTNTDGQEGASDE